MANRFLSARVSRLFVASFLGVAAAAARGDEDRAKAYLDAARDDIKNGNFDSVDRTLELFEEQLEGVDAGVTAKLKADAEAIRKDAADKKFVAQFDEAEKALARMEKDRDLARQIKAAQDNPKDENAIARLGGAVKDCENYKAEILDKLPAGHSRTKQITERYQKFAGPILKVSMAAERDKLLERLKASWQQSQDQAKQQFTDDPPVPYDQWLKGTSLAITSDLTFTRAAVAKGLLDDSTYKPFETAFADDPEVKATFAELRKAYDAGVAKLIKEVGGRVEAMEKAAPDTNNFPRVSQATQRLAELAPSNADAVALNARAEKMLARWRAGDAAADEAQRARVDAWEKTAEEMWPAIVAKYEGKTADVDPAAALADINAFKGKLVRFEGKENVGGTTFGAPDFAYVATVDGKPIAFKLDKRQLAIADRYRDANGGRPISLTDFRDVIGRVVGTGKVNHLQYDSLREQYITIGQVDVPVCEIVAFKSRYVTVGEDGKTNLDAVK